MESKALPKVFVESNWFIRSLTCDKVRWNETWLCPAMAREACGRWTHWEGRRTRIWRETTAWGKVTWSDFSVSFVRRSINPVVRHSVTKQIGLFVFIADCKIDINSTTTNFTPAIIWCLSVCKETHKALHVACWNFPILSPDLPISKKLCFFGVQTMNKLPPSFPTSQSSRHMKQFVTKTFSCNNALLLSNSMRHVQVFACTMHKLPPSFPTRQTSRRMKLTVCICLPTSRRAGKPTYYPGQKKNGHLDYA